MNFTGQVRRLDFNFRAKYPDLLTEIFQCTDTEFVIYCKGDIEGFSSLERDFQHAICPASLLSVVNITREKPNPYLAMIPNLADAEIAKDFLGVTHTASTLLNLLLAKFPSIPFHQVKREGDIILVVTTTYEEKLNDTTFQRYLNAADKLKVESFLSGLEVGIPVDVVEVPGLGPDAVMGNADSNPVRFICAVNAKRSLATPYELRDEAVWYDNLDQIFAGTFNKNSLYFFDPATYACYVDYTYGNIDLRNHLLLFQCVYLTPPYGDNGSCDLTNWLASLKISKTEFLGLAARNRIKLVLTQPNCRYDRRFIQEVYEAQPTAVITRRALAALLQIDLVETADNYLLNTPSLLPELRALSGLLGEKLQLDSTYLYESLSWPIRARRQSFEALNANGIYSTAAFGVNTFLEPFIRRVTNRDLGLEFSVAAANIHLANALNATCFPHATPDGEFSDQVFASIMGEALNFYKNSTFDRFKSLVDSQQKVESGVLPINPIEVFDINSYVSIEELERVLSQDTDHAGSKKLMETLAALSPERRKAKIDFYNKQIRHKLDKKWFSSWQMDLSVNVAVDGIALASNGQFLGTVYWLLSRGSGFVKRLPFIKNTLSKFEEAFYSSNSDRTTINYLTQINRVAQLRRFPS